MGESVNAEKSTLTVKTIVAGGFALALAFGSGLWAASAWKTGVDARAQSDEEHAQRIDEHMRSADSLIQRLSDQLEVQGEEIRWLIQHNPDANKAPMDWRAEHGEFRNPFADVSQAPQHAEMPNWR